MYLLIRNCAISSLLWSIARCNSVCWQSSGPGPQQSVSAPYLTRIDATSS